MCRNAGNVVGQLTSISEATITSNNAKFPYKTSHFEDFGPSSTMDNQVTMRVMTQHLWILLWTGQERLSDW